jgi:hypothetical protein
MPGISKRIISFAKFYNQLKFLVIVVRSFVKWAPYVATSNPTVGRGDWSFVGDHINQGLMSK